MKKFVRNSPRKPIRRKRSTGIRSQVTYDAPPLERLLRFASFMFSPESAGPNRAHQVTGLTTTNKRLLCLIVWVWVWERARQQLECLSHCCSAVLSHGLDWRRWAAIFVLRSNTAKKKECPADVGNLALAANFGTVVFYFAERTRHENGAKVTVVRSAGSCDTFGQVWRAITAGKKLFSSQET